jgi:membrane-associated phospholipid phosphatase
MVLFAARAFGWRRTWWLALYPVSIWVGIVYLGEHYVFDVVLGVAYATATYQAVSWLFLSKREPEYGPVSDTRSTNAREPPLEAARASSRESGRSLRADDPTS